MDNILDGRSLSKTIKTDPDEKVSRLIKNPGDIMGVPVKANS